MQVTDINPVLCFFSFRQQKEEVKEEKKEEKVPCFLFSSLVIIHSMYRFISRSFQYIFFFTLS